MNLKREKSKQNNLFREIEYVLFVLT